MNAWNSTLKPGKGFTRSKKTGLTGVLSVASRQLAGRAKKKTGKCRVCKTQFTKRSMTHVACSPDCAKEVAKIKREKEERKELKARREAIKPRFEYMRETQAVFNSWVRAKDAHLPCISCGNTKERVKYNAGHYLSVGAHPALRFHPDNVHKQCEHCNSYLSGNIAAYRPNLLAKIGAERLAWLEGPHEPKKYSIEELKEIKAFYRLKLKELQAAQAAREC